jgi:hypothetical protein
MWKGGPPMLASPVNSLRLQGVCMPRCAKLFSLTAPNQRHVSPEHLDWKYPPISSDDFASLNWFPSHRQNPPAIAID